MNIILVLGFGLFGVVLPELCNAIGGGKIDIPAGQNAACAISLMAISQYFVM